MALARLARWSYRRRRLVLALWIVALVGINIVGKSIGNDFKNQFGGGKTDSAQAFDLLKTRFPARAGDTADIVYKADQGVNDPAVRSALDGLYAEVRTAPHVIGIDAPRVSADGKVADATVQFDKEVVDLPNNTAKPLMAAVKAMPKPSGLQVELGGDVVARAIQQQPGGTEAIGLIAAIIILFLAFGSFLAMGLPVLTAVFGVGVGAVFVTLLSHALVMPDFAPQLAFMIGLGVGIDYALFIVTRYRAGLHDGLDPEGATVLALTTSGRAVLFAGCTVIIALLGMFLMGVSFIYGLALSASMAVAMVMLASVTLLPAILGFAGLKLAGKEKHPGGRGPSGVPAGVSAGRSPERTNVQSHRETVAYRWSREVQRHPLSLALLSLGVLVVIALPLFSIHLGSSDHGNDPKKTTTRKAYDLLAEGFGAGSNGPVIVAAELPTTAGANGAATAYKLQGTIATDKDVAFAVPPRLNQAGDAAVLVVIPKGSPQDRSTEQLVHRLRSDTVPAVTAGTGVVAHVGGITAGYIDSGDRIGQRLVLVIGAVILLSFLLLLAVFRSVLVAVKAAIMNMLSIGAAYGVIVAIFQWGWLGKVFGVSRTGPIESWVPLMLFTIVFGLSMDYEVFLLSRVREEYLVTGDNAQAVADGLAATARVITAAAAIMVCVFSSFVLGDVRVLKLFGLGLASAVLIDATIVRMVLVPSTMELLGKANWWFPHWLDRVVPHISVEAAPAERELVGAAAD